MAKILVVDDDPPTRQLVRAALEGMGHSISEAANGAEGLIAANNEKPDLVVMDVMMPVMDGFQTLHAMKSNPITGEIPVVMLTARAGDMDMAQGWREGVDFYLTKPFSIDELVSVIKRMLSSSEKEE